jgi:predicted AAA+ superfamily ATPase
LERRALKNLVAWKKSSGRKPLVLRGARQTGKTWLMKEFGRLHFNSAAYFNFDEEERLKSIFETNKDPLRIIELLGHLRGKKISSGDLIIFDEIQECPAALNSLKYFCESASNYHVVSAGSLLGAMLAQPKSYPVGKVNLLDVRPMLFDEFLEAVEPALFGYYSSIERGSKIETIFHQKLLDAYSQYLIIGGMPECVSEWAQTRDPAKVQRAQGELVSLYEYDFSKHRGKVNAGRILLVFRSIAPQLAKDSGKFMYGHLKGGARAREFEEAIEWLASAGLVIRAFNVAKPEHPLGAYEQHNHFKLYMLDVGLLRQMAGVSSDAILLKSGYQFKGALTENFVLQQIRDAYGHAPCFFAPPGKGEIDFLVQDGANVIPIEVKSGENKRAASFKNYLDKRSPKKAIRFSKLEYEINGRFTNIPLYLAGRSKELS